MRKKKYPCPCCGRHTINKPGDFEICPICGWEDDKTQSDDIDFDGGANELSLRQAREKYKATKK